MIDDAELLRRYAEEKSETAFSELVRRHLGLVYACALRRVAGDAQMAQEVTQQVFTDVARRAGVLARRPVLAGWLFTSTRFAAAKAMRATRRRLDREQEAYTMQELTSETAAQIDWERARPVLDDAIEELSERDREAVLLRYFEGRDFSTVGAKLNLTDNAARMRVERALEKLRTLLERRGITSTASAISLVLAEQSIVAMPAGLAASVTGAALVGGAVATGGGSGAVGLAAIGFMTKMQIGIVTAVVVAGATGLVIQEQNRTELRSEIANLQRQNREIAALRTEKARLESSAAEAVRLRQDALEAARLRDQAAALRESLSKIARMREEQPSPTPAPRRLTRTTAEVFSKLKPLQEAKDWAGMMRLLDELLPQVEATSYDMALILDMKAKLYVTQGQYAKAIEPWEKAVQLSDQFKYFGDAQTCDLVYFLAQLRLQAGGLTAQAPQAVWF